MEFSINSGAPWPSEETQQAIRVDERERVVTENLDIKTKILNSCIPHLNNENTIIATNTSSLSVTELGARRTTFEVGVRYGTDVDLAGRVLEEAAASCDTTYPDPAPEALISEMGDHSIEFLLRFWHDPRILEAERAKDAVGRAITHAFAQHGLVIAFPQRTLWWGDGAKPGESDG